MLEEWASPNGHNPTLSRLYVYGHDLVAPKQQVTGQWVIHYYGYDANGNTRFLANQDGIITDTYNHDAFGILIDQHVLLDSQLVPLTAASAPPVTPNNYLYSEEQWDKDLGLYSLRARYYHPETGRFWTMDTYEGFQSDPMSLHKYVALHNDPVNRVDPSGHNDSIQTLATSKIGITIATFGGPAIAAANRALPTIVRGTARAWDLANRVVASGGDIVALEDRVMRATQAGMQVIGRFKLDVVVRLPGKAINTLIESKGVPWHLYGTSGWDGYIRELQAQADAFSQATQTGNGVTIG